jgi:hypothetical protein
VQSCLHVDYFSNHALMIAGIWAFNLSMTLIKRT